jgi:hypothetical protein
MNGYQPTPRMTKHARERCVEMGISTKVAKAIVRNVDMTYSGSPKHDNDAMLAYCDQHPDHVVVFAMDEDVPVILTVLPRTNEYYQRPEHGRA